MLPATALNQPAKETVIMITNLLTSLVLPMTGWCASPNGCRPVSTPVETVAPVNDVIDIGTIDGSVQTVKDAGQDFAQQTIDNTVDNAMSAVFWELGKLALLIVGAILVFVFIKKFFAMSSKRSKEYLESLQAKGSPLIEEHRRALQQMNAAGSPQALIGDKFLDANEVMNELQYSLDENRSFYEDEMVKQSEIQLTFEDSLEKPLQQERISLDADDLDLNSLNETVKEGMQMIRTKPLDELYKDYSSDLSMEDLLPTDLNAINAIVEDFKHMPQASTEEIAKSMLDYARDRTQGIQSQS